MSRKRRKILLILVAVLAVVALVQTVRSYVNRRKIPGIYLAEGGVRCYVIRSGFPWGLSLETDIDRPAVETRLGVSFTGKRLTLTAGTSRQVKALLPSNVALDFGIVNEFVASPSRSGDWDLAAYGDSWSRIRPPVSPPPPKNWFEQLLGRWFPKRIQAVPLPRPVPFLHRLDDARVVSYSDLQYSQERPRDAFDTARSLLKDHPNDPYVRSLYVNAAARNNDTSEVGRRLEEWKPDFGGSADPILSVTYAETQRWLQSRQMTAAGRNAFDFILRLVGDETDLSTRLRLLPALLDFEGYVPAKLPGPVLPGSPSFLNIQLGVKVFRVIAVLEMLEGKRDENLRSLATVYRLGQFMTESGYGIDSIIGIAIKSIAAAGLETYAMNCCETDSDFRNAWAILERLEKAERPLTGKDLLRFEVARNEYMPPGSFNPDFAEYEGRLLHTNSRFELVRMATAAKCRLVTQGDFPKSNSEFAPLLSQGLPNDPFGDGPLRFVLTTGPLICYSVGPDKKDDRATIEYDPTNGTTSAGDILLRVPRERQYPFPRNGVRAASVEDLLRQFPNGLPPDPFATTRGKGLGTTATAEGDVCIYSYGPNVDEVKPPQPHVLEVQYDPTNGLTSAGDLFIRIPRP